MAGARRPTQERGQRRVDAILDAAAALIPDVGVEGLTVAAIAERAQTSKGSMYHFFADLDHVVRALAERHVAAIRSLADEVRTTPDVNWSAIEPEEAIERIIGPIGRYIDAHPDVSPVMRSSANQARLATGGEGGLHIIAGLIKWVMRQRTPGVEEAHLDARAAAMVAILQAMKAEQPNVLCGAEALRTELRRALAAYLGAAERAPARPAA